MEKKSSFILFTEGENPEIRTLRKACLEIILDWAIFYPFDTEITREAEKLRQSITEPDFYSYSYFEGEGVEKKFDPYYIGTINI